jgi:transcriptional regulator with XRE-family HTH domain
MSGSAITDITEIPTKEKPKTAPKGIPLERLIELRKKNLTHKEIAKIEGIARETVSRRLAKHDIDGIDIYKKHEADILTYQRRRIINSITDADIKKTPAIQRASMYGIFYDKERLERNMVFFTIKRD